MQTEQLLCWSGITDTNHSTSSSNEEEELKRLVKIEIKLWIMHNKLMLKLTTLRQFHARLNSMLIFHFYYE